MELCFCSMFRIIVCLHHILAECEQGAKTRTPQNSSCHFCQQSHQSQTQPTACSPHHNSASTMSHTRCGFHLFLFFAMLLSSHQLYTSSPHVQPDSRTWVFWCGFPVFSGLHHFWKGLIVGFDQGKNHKIMHLSLLWSSRFCAVVKLTHLYFYMILYFLEERTKLFIWPSLLYICSFFSPVQLQWSLPELNVGKLSQTVKQLTNANTTPDVNSRYFICFIRSVNVLSIINGSVLILWVCSSILASVLCLSHLSVSSRFYLM